MPSYIVIGDNNNIAQKVKSLYLGDNNAIAHKIKNIYIGDENGKAQQAYRGIYTTTVTYYTSAVNSDGLSSTTALTRESTSGTSYMTNVGSGWLVSQIRANSNYTYTYYTSFGQMFRFAKTSIDNYRRLIIYFNAQTNSYTTLTLASWINNNSSRSSSTQVVSSFLLTVDASPSAMPTPYPATYTGMLISNNGTTYNSLTFITETATVTFPAIINISGTNFHHYKNGTKTSSGSTTIIEEHITAPSLGKGGTYTYKNYYGGGTKTLYNYNYNYTNRITKYTSISKNPTTSGSRSSSAQTTTSKGITGAISLFTTSPDYIYLATAYGSSTIVYSESATDSKYIYVTSVTKYTTWYTDQIGDWVKEGSSLFTFNPSTSSSVMSTTALTRSSTSGYSGVSSSTCTSE